MRETLKTQWRRKSAGRERVRIYLRQNGQPARVKMVMALHPSATRLTLWPAVQPHPLSCRCPPSDLSENINQSVWLFLVIAALRLSTLCPVICPLTRCAIFTFTLPFLPLQIYLWGGPGGSPSPENLEEVHHAGVESCCQPQVKSHMVSFNLLTLCCNSTHLLF